MPSGEYVPTNYTYTVGPTSWNNPGATVTQWNTDVLTQQPTTLNGNVTITNNPGANYIGNFGPSYAANGNDYGLGNNYTYTGGFVATEAFDKHSAEILAIKKFLGLDKEEPLEEKPSKKPSKRVHYDYPGDGSRWGDL